MQWSPTAIILGSEIELTTEKNPDGVWMRKLNGTVKKGSSMTVATSRALHGKSKELDTFLLVQI
jgi:hypothetical protein